MVWDGPIEGKYVRLRSIAEEDTEFSLAIRQDPKKTKYLHRVENDREKQLNWIRQQRKRQGDYFFVVEQLDGKKVGTVGIYNISGSVGESGRLLMIGNPVQTFEAELLVLRFAYDDLKLEKLFANVCADNRTSLRLGETIGFHFDAPAYDAEEDCYMQRGTAQKAEFSEYASKISKLIYRGRNA